ncbi:hypothetical protein GCM10017673_43100 [Streptosporangium violaceochromogenes]|nr:hypothetical protein GCM10017673_43100 [Streptosporangium violaceochromogenes]
MAPGPHDPRSREWPADDDGHDEATYGSRRREPQSLPPAIQHSPPGPSGDDTRGLPPASPWMLPPFAAPTPDDTGAPRPRPQGGRRRTRARPYSSDPVRPPLGSIPPITLGPPVSPADPLTRASGPGRSPEGEHGPESLPGEGRPEPWDTVPWRGAHRRPVDGIGVPAVSGPRPSGSGGVDHRNRPPRRTGSGDDGHVERPGVSRGSEDGRYGDLLGPPGGAADDSGGDSADDSGRAGGFRDAGRDGPPSPSRGPVGGDYGGLLDPRYEPAGDHSAPPPEEGSRRRRNRPDLLVASGPPRRPAQPGPAADRADDPAAAFTADPASAPAADRDAPERDIPAPGAPDGDAPGAPERDVPGRDAPDAPERADRPAGSVPPPGRGEGSGSADDAGDAPPTATTPEPGLEPGLAEEGSEPVHRVGRPPGGRPTRPDLLVAQGPSGGRGGAGRHQRPADAPSAVRRSSPTRRRRGRGLTIPLVMVVALAVAVGGGLVLWGWVSDPFATGLRLAGEEVRHGDAGFTPLPGAGGDGSSQVLNAVASVGSVMVAVGSDTTSPVPRPLFLVSTDGGASWDLGTVTGSAGYDNGPATVGRVTGGDGRWLAGGNDLLGTGRGLWTSEDGRAWTAVDPGGLRAFSAGDKIMDLARTSSGFVVVGTTTLPNGSAGAVAWVSPDGRSWERVDSREIGTPDKVRGLKAVVARGDVVVALGDPAPGGSGPAVLRSADGGRTWTHATSSPAGVVPEAGALAAAKDGFVLVPTQRRDDRGEVGVYCSAEGTDWSRCGTITGLARDGSGVKRLASSSAGVAAITESGFERYAVYTSEDGRKWSRSTDLGEVPGSLRALAVSDEGTLVVGGDERAADVDNRLVLMTAPRGGEARPVALERIKGLSRAARDTTRVAAGDGTFVAVGAASGDAGIWSSADGRAWKATGSPQVLGGSHRQALGDVTSGRRGWLAVGSTMTDASSTAPLLVTSDDGREWRRVPATGPLAPAAEHDFLAPHAVASGPSGYVLAGEDRGPSTTVPVLWFSSDLKRYTRAARLPAGGGGVRLHDVSATSSGYVAVGGMGTAERETGVVWVSADGVNWVARKPVLPPGATSAGLRHVVLHGGTVVAAGTATTGDGQRAFAAVSDDNGSTWEFTWLPADRAAAVQDLAATAAGVVAVGWQGAPGERDGMAWTSEDGREWQPHTPAQDSLDGEGAQWLGAVAISGGEVVALGRSTTYRTDHLTLWRSTLSSDG